MGANWPAHARGTSPPRDAAPRGHAAWLQGCLRQTAELAAEPLFTMECVLAAVPSTARHRSGPVRHALALALVATRSPPASRSPGRVTRPASSRGEPGVQPSLALPGSSPARPKVAHPRSRPRFRRASTPRCGGGRERSPWHRWRNRDGLRESRSAVCQGVRQAPQRCAERTHPSR